MKTKSFFVAVLMVVSSVVAFAGKEDPRTGFAIVPVKGSEIFKVIYKGQVSGKVKLNIYDNSGSVIFAETLYGVDGFIAPLNFAGLKSGEYTIELISANGRQIEKIFHTAKMDIKAEKGKSVHVRKIGGQAGKYLFTIAGSGSEVVNVKIFDEANNLIHQESKAIDGDFAQVYKLEGASTSYTFEVTDGAGNLKTIRF